jgi:DNA excision repair protein ERCC-2
VSIIAATVSARAGNYIVYFPSYDCLDKVYKSFTAKYPSVKTVVQQRNMGFAQKEEFLSGFKADTGHLRVGFCVLGGAFSEGVDLPGNRLIGTVIFGTGLPGLSNERNIIRDYFDEDTGRGYDYAYTYPGMNNVLQAAGRVIRTENDRGVVVLVDDRYATPQYRQLFPQHWKNVQYAGNTRSLAEIAKRFWHNEG